MLNAAELDSLLVEYVRCTMSSTTIQEILRDEVPTPYCSLVEFVVGFAESCGSEPQSDPRWPSFLGTCKQQYLRFICILGNMPVEMPFTALIQHAFEYGRESARVHRGMRAEARGVFWEVIADIDSAIRSIAEDG